MNLFNKVSDITRYDWDFSGCPVSELDQCRSYEYGRHSETLQQAITKFRSTHRCEKFDAACIAKASAKGKIDWGSISKRFSTLMAPWSIFGLSPEWPQKPYLSIDPKERRRRIEAIWPKVWDDELDNAAFEEQFQGILQQCESGLATPGDTFYDAGDNCWVAAFRIDWSKSKEHIVQQFRNWLYEHAKHTEQIVTPRETRGAGNHTRQLKTDLKALAAYRLLSVMICAGAQSFTNPHLIKPLFPNDARWSEAKRRAEAILEKLRSKESD